METKINNIDLFKVKDNENTYYGFSQEWYKDEWQRRAGCGATVASSIINYYNQKNNFKLLFFQVISKFKSLVF